MNPQKAVTLLLTPIIGMLPIVAFFVFDCFFSYPVALLAAGVTFVVYFLVVVVWLKQELPYTIFILLFLFVLFAALSVIKPFNLLYITRSSVVLELFIILIFYLCSRLQGYFKAKIFQGKDERTQEFLLLKYDSNLYIIKKTIVLACLHLGIVLLYQLFPENYHSLDADRMIYFYLLFLFVSLHYTYEFVHWNLLKKQIRTEEWLPIVDESGAVHGKVALSVSLHEDTYLHPIIRIVLIHKGMLFLKPKTNESGLLDYPFERYLRFQETLEDGVREAFITNGETADLPARFMFRYVYKETNRMVYLYACNITDEEALNTLHLEEGKWWTGKQIEDNLNTGLFSSYFEKEYEFLSTTILMADRLMNDIEKITNC
jgi:hypothetical protein